MMKRIIILGLGLGFILTPVLAPNANEVIETNTVTANLTLDNGLVDYSIDKIEGTNYATEFTEGMYLINYIASKTEVNIQAATKDEIYRLGYIDDIVDNIPRNTVPSFDRMPNNKPIIILNDGSKYGYKQVIKEEEISKLNNIIATANKEIERDSDSDVNNSAGNHLNKDRDKLNTDGPAIPKTATNMYNIMAIGLTFITAGFILYLLRNRNQKEEVGE